MADSQAIVLMQRFRCELSVKDYESVHAALMQLHAREIDNESCASILDLHLSDYATLHSLFISYLWEYDLSVCIAM